MHPILTPFRRSQMNIVVDPLAWQYAATGGVLIGLAAALLLWASGAISGISGIFAAAVLGQRTISERGWRIAFVAGLLIGAALFALYSGGLTIHLQTTWPGMLLGGLAVGIGTRLGNGCTSGHGVCGLARLSGRSFAAVATFMACAVLTVFVMRLAGLR